MSNRILNGDFSSGFDHWNNGVGGGEAFNLVAGQAQGFSLRVAKTYKMCQQFSSNDEIITATITVWAAWEAYDSEVDGYNRFIVELEKPNTTMVTLVDTTKTAVIGSGNILSASNVKTHMTQYGNYKLWLTLVTQAAVDFIHGEPNEYRTSYGTYDNINLNIVVKKYKAVHEVLGSSGRLGGKASVSKSEIIGLSESYSTEVYSPTFNYESASDVVGLIESYSILTKRLRNAVESVGLKEALQAKRIQGNLETTYVLQDLTQWTEISRVETPWIKKKIEV